jgi:molybdopterin-guanine dinucleotide biosynthesis protein B
MTPIWSIIGKSGSGKTTLLEKLIPALKRRGLKVGTIKHHAHSGFEIDQPGKDTWRHAQAGSDHVVIAAPDKIAHIRKLEAPLSVTQIAEAMSDVDIILTEGFKSAGLPALEVLRAERGLELVSDRAQLRAIATDTPVDVNVPQFDLNDAEAMADFILRCLENQATVS